MHGGHVESQQIPTLSLEAAVLAHRGLFVLDLALQKPISHTKIPPLSSEVDGARHNLEVEAGDTTSAPGRRVAVTKQEQRDRRFRRLFSRRRVVAKRLQRATGASARRRTPRNLRS